MKTHKRLDKILLELGLLTEEQIRHALARQKSHGGKFGSALLYHRYITEEGLVKALSIQFDMEGVILSQKEIPSEVAELIPAKVAQARRAIPFDYNPNDNLLKIAVADPSQKQLFDELSFVARGKDIELYIASEVAVVTAIEKLYFGGKKSLEDSMMVRIPVEYTTVEDDESEATEIAPKKVHASSRVCIVTDEAFSAPLIKSVIERDGPEVEICGTLAEALDILKKRFVEVIYIKETLADEHAQAEASIRAQNFRTEIVWYENLSQLTLNRNRGASADSLKSVELLISLLGALSGDEEGRAQRLGRYTAKICDKLSLPALERSKVVTAALLHHLSMYTGAGEAHDNSARKEIMRATADLLESISFDSDVSAILRMAYADLNWRDTAATLSRATLGGNILTAADTFCDRHPQRERITLVQFDEIRAHYYGQVGKTLLPEVVDALILTLQSECLNQELVRPRGEVVYYYHSGAMPDAFIPYDLNARGVRVTSATNLDDLRQVCERRTPDAIIIALKDKDNALKVVNEMTSNGIDLRELPGIVIGASAAMDSVEKLFEAGIQDIVARNDGHEILTAKLLTIIEKGQRLKRGGNHQPPAAHGKLANINLIDLIQALGPGRKTVKITLHNDDREMVAYLIEGSMTYAKLGEIEGPEAVFEAVTWSEGEFTILSIDPVDAPASNIQESNESILMEGCRLMDERLNA